MIMLATYNLFNTTGQVLSFLYSVITSKYYT